MFQGGLKAAILADVIQGLIMIGCTLAIIIKGSLDTGGIDYIVKTNYEHGRLQLFKYDFDWHKPNKFSFHFQF